MSQKATPLTLGEGKINKLMLKFSIPCILSLLVSSLYNIVDQIFIGNSELSTLGNAATGVVFPVFIIAQAFAWCFGDGCAAYLNICQGRNDDENAHKAIGASITAAFLSGLLTCPPAWVYPASSTEASLRRPCAIFSVSAQRPASPLSFMQQTAWR